MNSKAKWCQWKTKSCWKWRHCGFNDTRRLIKVHHRVHKQPTSTATCLTIRNSWGLLRRRDLVPDIIIPSRLSAISESTYLQVPSISADRFLQPNLRKDAPRQNDKEWITHELWLLLLLPPPTPPPPPPQRMTRKFSILPGFSLFTQSLQKLLG